MRILQLLIAASLCVYLPSSETYALRSGDVFELCIDGEVKEIAGKELWIFASRWMLIRELRADPQLYQWVVSALDDKWRWWDENPAPLPAHSSVDERREWFKKLQEKKEQWRYKGREVVSNIPRFDSYFQNVMGKHIGGERVRDLLKKESVCRRESEARDSRLCLNFLTQYALPDISETIIKKVDASMPRWIQLGAERCEIAFRRVGG